MPQLELRFLGPVHIEVNGTPLKIVRSKAQALLSYLAVTGDDQSRDGLLALLWSDVNQRRARAALRNALWELNKSPLGDWLEIDTETVSLNRTAEVWLDVTHFQQLLARCQTHNHPANEACPDCLAPLTEAVELYRGDFLSGFTLPDAPYFDEWHFFQTESLRQQLASTLERLARWHAVRGDLEAALSHARQRVAHDLWRRSLVLLDDPALANQDIRPERAFILRQIGGLPSLDAQEARQLSEQSLALYRALGDRWRTAEILQRLGELNRLLGHYDKARQLQEEGLTIRQEIDDTQGIAHSLCGLGLVLKYQGQIEEAERLHRAGLALFRKIGDQSGLAMMLQLMGSILNFGGKFVEARSFAEEGVQLCTDLGYRQQLALSMMGLTEAEQHLGYYHQARTKAKKNLALFREIGDFRGSGWVLTILGELALAEEKYIKAEQLLQECLANFQESGERGAVGVPLSSLGHAACGLGNIRQARQYLVEGVQIATEKKSAWSFWYLLPAIALLLANRGEKERAVELYALASGYPHVANSRWFEDVAGRQVAVVASTLPPEVAAAAQERGRARDLWQTAEELLTELESAKWSENE